MFKRDFKAELKAASETQNWELHAQIWEDRRIASVQDDEDGLHEFEMSADRDWLRKAEYGPESFDEMERQDREGRS